MKSVIDRGCSATRLMLALALAASALPGCGDSAVDPATSVRFAVIGDYGVDTTNEARVALLVKSYHPQFILTVGDNNYPNGEASTIDANIGKYYAEYIGGYRGAYGRGSPTNRFWPTMGNHEWYSTPPAQPYYDYFPALPGNKRYYDVELGLVHIFTVFSDDRGPEGTPTVTSVQASWLQGRLAASTSCFNVVYFHHPPFSSGDFSVTWMQWPFQAWGADVVMAGHEHFYERLAVDGIPYIIDGLGGANIFGFKAAPDSHSQFRYNNDFGALFVTATARGITYEFHAASGLVVDAFTVPKNCR